MDVMTAIAERASATKLIEPGPTAEQLEAIMLAGLQYPDHGRLAPARFVVIGADKREQLGDALADSLLRSKPQATDVQLAAERKKALRAPLIIAVAARLVRGHKVPVLEQMSAVSAGIQNMFLAARALGLGAMWKTGGPAYDPELNKTLGLQGDDQILAFFYVGTPEGEKAVFTPQLEGAVTWL